MNNKTSQWEIKNPKNIKQEYSKTLKELHWSNCVYKQCVMYIPYHHKHNKIYIFCAVLRNITPAWSNLILWFTRTWRTVLWLFDWQLVFCACIYSEFLCSLCADVWKNIYHKKISIAITNRYHGLLLLCYMYIIIIQLEQIVYFLKT